MATCQKNLLEDSAVSNEPDEVFAPSGDIVESNEAPSAPGSTTFRFLTPALALALPLSTKEIFK